MDTELTNRRRELAEQAANEQDPLKLYALIQQINRLDQQKKHPPRGKHSSASD